VSLKAHFYKDQIKEFKAQFKSLTVEPKPALLILKFHFRTETYCIM